MYCRICAGRRVLYSVCDAWHAPHALRKAERENCCVNTAFGDKRPYWPSDRFQRADGPTAAPPCNPKLVLSDTLPKDRTSHLRTPLTGPNARRRASLAPPSTRAARAHARLRGASRPWRAARSAGESSDNTRRLPAQQLAHPQRATQQYLGVRRRRAGRQRAKSAQTSEQRAVSRGLEAAYGWRVVGTRAGAHSGAHSPIITSRIVATADIMRRHSTTAPSCGESARMLRVFRPILAALRSPTHQHVRPRRCAVPRARIRSQR